ncbi:sensor histidine kinase [Thiomicrorhabdus sp. Milos-T2]|uniref:sensor histidine kinase n=1 Tax=Thiomicrorhabdus sp. Milos-T2 TaxID=90814 RepID=UPI0004942994|nr:HAMP domain-containing sensor histidine kinase [Thiomicrorhabdus sp. Milos-T2]
MIDRLIAKFRKIMSFIQPKTLIGRLNFYLGTGLIVVILSSGAAGYYLISHILHDAIYQKAEALAQQAAAISLDAVMLQEYSVIERMVDDLVNHNTDLIGLKIENERHQVLAEIEPKLDSQHEILHIEKPLTFFDQPAGKISLVFSLESIEKPLNQLSVILFLGLIIILFGLFYVVKTLLNKHLVNPISQLANDLNSSDKIFDEIIEFKADLPDELNILNHAIRELQEALKEHVKSLEDAHKFTNQATQNLCHSQRMATVGQMAAGLAHNLNTPLANIIGYAQMSMQQTQDEKLKKRLQTIERQAKTCSEQVKNLLSSSKPPVLELQSINLITFINQLVALIQPVAKRKAKIQLNLVAPPSLRAQVDKAALEQILFNLLTNSMEAKASHINIEVQESLTDNQIEVVVTDNGQGIEPEMQQRIFEPFFTTKSQYQGDTNGGTGLGLYLNKTLMQQMQGSIELIKSDSKGTQIILKVRKDA